MSGELWLGEGFTQYYGPLTLSRTGLEDLRDLDHDLWSARLERRAQPGARWCGSAKR